MKRLTKWELIAISAVAIWSILIIIMMQILLSQPTQKRERTEFEKEFMACNEIYRDDVFLYRQCIDAAIDRREAKK